MATSKTIETVQSLSNRELGKQVGKRLLPGVGAVTVFGLTIFIAPPLLAMATQAMG